MTTASQQDAAGGREVSDNSSAGDVVGPITPSEQPPSVVTSEPPEFHRLREENSDLAQK